MAVKTLEENPTISDTLQIEIQTTDEAGNPINPYRLDQVVIYFIERSFTANGYKTYTEKIGNSDNPQELTVYYTDSIPVKTYGDGSGNPAWDSTDPTDDYVEKVNFDDDGNALIGTFKVAWTPLLAQEGDYMICWKWTPLLASPKQSAHISFILYGDQQATTVMPSHTTPVGKYESLLNLYTPEMYKMLISSNDVTPDVLRRMNSAVGKGFNTLEDLVNQILDLIDANATHESLLPYLSNLFKHKLWSNDPTLWRRQIKRAIPLNKKKGTLGGLVEALASAGITLQKLTKYWQVVSQFTWTESFKVTEGQTSFVLSKKALLPMNVDNFVLKLRGNGEEDYVPLSLNYVSFSNSGDETTMVWLGDDLSSGAITLLEGDIVVITYLIKTVTNQSLENYIRSLPLMDTRDETTFSYPPKNWNVHLIAEDDALFNSIVTTKHPFAPEIIFGKVRTEFAYSENIYNMDEFNGSLRDSNLPCDIDKNFYDQCNACQSSSISLDLEMESLSDDRLKEAREIAKEYIPFHAQIHSINFSGAINEYIPPPVEDIEILIYTSINDYVFMGQSDFNRLIPILGTTEGQFLRNELSTAVTMASGTATGFNEDVVLFSPSIRFDNLNLINDNLLEILSGSNAGNYEVDSTNVGTGVVPIIQGSPDSISFPLNTAAFTFRLSNPMWTDASATIAQDDLFTFSDDNIDFTLITILTQTNSVTPWKIVVTSGIYAGTYNIYDTLPNNTLILSGWSGIINASSLPYRLVKNDGTIVFSSTTGQMAVTRRGRVTTQELESWGVKENDYILYSGQQYAISGFKDDEKTQPYILGYTSGGAAGVTITVYRRLLDNAIGYVDARGMLITTTPDYESLLSIQNGSNPPATPVETSSFKENYLVKISGNYYRIVNWDGQQIDLEGPKTIWGLTGTSVSFELVNYILTTPVIDGDVEFTEGLDRRGREPITTTTSVDGMPLTDGDGFSDSMRAVESITFQIQKRNGKTLDGVIQ